MHLALEGNFIDRIASVIPPGPGSDQEIGCVIMGKGKASNLQTMMHRPIYTCTFYLHLLHHSIHLQGARLDQEMGFIIKGRVFARAAVASDSQAVMQTPEMGKPSCILCKKDCRMHFCTAGCSKCPPAPVFSQNRFQPGETRKHTSLLAPT